MQRGFLELTWPILVTIVWVLVFEGATFFVGRRGARIARVLASIGGVLGMLFAAVHFYLAIHFAH